MLLISAGTKNAKAKRIWAFLILVSLVFSLCSVLLAVISHVYIHSYCIMCVLIYGINFMLLYYCWLIRRRFNSDAYFVVTEKRSHFPDTQLALEYFDAGGRS